MTRTVCARDPCRETVSGSTSLQHLLSLFGSPSSFSAILVCVNTHNTHRCIYRQTYPHTLHSRCPTDIHLTGVRRYIINQHTQPQDTIPSIFLVQRGPVWLIYQSCHLLLYTEVKDNHSQLTGGSPSTPLGKFSHTPRCCRP